MSVTLASSNENFSDVYIMTYILKLMLINIDGHIPFIIGVTVPTYIRLQYLP